MATRRRLPAAQPDRPAAQGPGRAKTSSGRRFRLCAAHHRSRYRSEGARRGRDSITKRLQPADTGHVRAAHPEARALDAVALAFAFLVVDGAVIVAMLVGWLEVSTGIIAVLALALAVPCRDDVTDALAVGNQMLGLAVDDMAARRASTASSAKAGRSSMTSRTRAGS